MSEETVAERAVTGETVAKEAGNSDKYAPAQGTLHHIVVVGGGAAGLELATGLGDKLGKRKKANITLIERSRTHLWKPLLHEVAAGSMNVDNHALDYLAQAHWHNFRYRYGEMIGLDRSKREVCLAATYDDEGNEITQARSFQYDTLVMAVGSTSNDFGTSSRSRWIPLNRRNGSTNVWSTPASGRMPNLSRCGKGSFTSRSSGQAPPARNWRRSFTGPPGRWRPSAWIGSIRKRISASH
jgi:NADH dehydrogenase